MPGRAIANLATESVPLSSNMSDHKSVCHIGINGFGRIGRGVLRASLQRSDVVVRAINHTCDTVDDLLHLISFDSTYGRLEISSHTAVKMHALSNGNISINGQEIHLTSQRDLTKLDWSALGVDYVAECTGKFRTAAQAVQHVTHGKAKRVLISAPSPDAPTFVYKVNSDKLGTSADSKVVSCASCTTNCLAPLAKAIDEAFGIERGFITTVHAATQSQQVLDGYSRKSRRAGRSVMGNIIPATTGAAKAINKVMPHMEGRFSAMAIRVPVANVSMIDFAIYTKIPTSLEEMMASLHASAKGSLAGVLAVDEQELVSSDFSGHPCSSIVDAKACAQLSQNAFRLVAWYDNEWSYSCRLLDVLALMAEADA